jgi:hypothetical protein
VVARREFFALMKAFTAGPIPIGPILRESFPTWKAMGYTNENDIEEITATFINFGSSTVFLIFDLIPSSE